MLIIITHFSYVDKFLITDKELEKDKTYYVRIAGFDGACSDDQFNFKVTNDPCALAGWKYMITAPNLARMISDAYNPPIHKGIDVVHDTWREIRNGYEITAVADGEIIHIGKKHKSMGNCVVIKGDDGYTTRYLHMRDDEKFPYVSTGRIKAGKFLGYVGDTGSPDNWHLHFDVNTIGTWDGGNLNTTNVINTLRFFPHISFTYQ